MRNLKKLLSLVLAVAMIASFCVVGVSAAEPTYSETTKYAEAAAVITSDKIAVMDGTEKGMEYDAPVTREQAATIICRILLGTDAAAKLQTATAPFADVAANRWSAGYIAYLKQQGIVSGVTETTFDPEAGVTALQFAKMLLCATGRGVNGEYEGAGWDINTITDANANSLFADTQAADLTAGATREECMLYAFNGMTKMPVVKYNKVFESYYVGTNPMSAVNGELDPVADQDGKFAATNPYTYTLGYTNFKLYQSATADTQDGFGRPSTSWMADGAVVAENIASRKPNATLYGKINSAILYNTLGKTVVNGLNADLANSVTLWEDGVEKASNGLSKIVAGQTGVNGNVTGAGATTELYVDYANGKYTMTMVVVYEYIGTVTKVSAASNEITVNADGRNYTVSGETMNIAGLKKGDKVIVTIDKDPYEIASIEAAESVVGTFASNWTAGPTIITATFDGKPYSVSAKATAATTTILAASANFGNSYTIYTDSFGNILAVELYEEAVSSYEYLYVTGVESQKYSNGVLNGQEAKVALSVVYAEGGKDVLYCATKYDNAQDDYYVTVKGEKKFVADNMTSAIPEGWYSYTKDENGKVTLKDADTAISNIANTIKPATGKASVGISGYMAGSKTVLTVVNENGNVVTYTGIANFPTYETAQYATVYTFDTATSKTITHLYAFAGEAKLSNNDQYAYLVMSTGANTDGVSYMFYVDGVMTVLTIDDNGAANAYAEQIVVLTETDGEYAVSPVTGVKTVNSGLDYAGNAEPDAAYAKFDFTTNSKKSYEWAVIDTVDTNYFTTVAITADAYDEVAEETDGVAYPDNVYQGELEARTYYYDSNTVIYDCTANNGMGAVVDSLDTGRTFMAIVDTDASATYKGVDYCSYIWLVG